MKKKIDFIAELTYLTKEQGGRNSPVVSGYRPQVKFGFEKRQTSGHQNFIGTEKVYPGETALAEITVISPEFFENRLEIGMEFDFREGHIVVGKGIVKEIINKTPKKKKTST
ncbi:elongation factor Tu [Maribacter sp. MAR_2009_72]|uniref:EF-Tu C-terminal domain-related protein n=1 Tax=Maribacter sp. MAR_2009_72 TaxID=1250050 RepID=UPI00119CD671|nr:elongation factor Tu [Maribacter sp. MAR_2009_72]